MKWIFKFLSVLLIQLHILTPGNCQDMTQFKQSVVPPSPTAFELGKYGQIPTGTFTGSAQYTIPLFNLTGNRLSLPLSLSYSSNGVQVGSTDPWVGNGWSLNAGGVITRIVKDIPDEQRNSFVNEDQIFSSNDSIRSSAWWSICTDYDNTRVDTEPDLYAFNFNGYTGKFIINNGEIILLPYQNLKIEKSGPYFTITVPDGVKYYFDQCEHTKSQSSIQDGQDGVTDCITAVYLSKITHPTGEEINLTYKQGYYVDTNTPNSYAFSTVPVATGLNNPLYCPSLIPPLSDGYPINQELHITSKYLNTISNGKIDITFYSSKTRLDIDDYKLDSLSIQDKYSASPEKKIVLSYITTANLRLFLTSVKETGNKLHKFDYENMQNVPVRNSDAIDHFGYYNGATGNLHTVPVPSEYASFFPISSANRDPNPTYAINGLLNKITYPTGGTTEIVFEPHDYWDGVQCTNVTTGGMRVKRVISKKSIDDQNPEITRYYYADKQNISRSSGLKPATPEYFMKSSILTDCSPEEIFNRFGYCICSPSLSQPYCICSQIVTVYNLTSNSNNLLYNISNYHIGYSSVLKSHGENFENGGEYFNYVNNYSDSPPQILMSSIQNTTIPGATYSNSGRFSSLLVGQGIIKYSGSFITLKEESYNYNLSDSRKYKKVEALIIRNRINRPSPTDCTNLYSTTFDVASYKIESDWPYISSKLEKIYDQNGQNPISTTTSYFYDNAEHAQLTREETLDSKGNTLKKIIYYPKDCDTTALNFGILSIKHIDNSPVDWRKYVNTKLVEGQQIKYNDYGQPIELYEAETNGTDLAFAPSNPYVFTLKDSISYDTNKNIEQSTKKNNIPTSFVWAYSNNYPVVRIVGIESAEISSAIKANIPGHVFSGSTDYTEIKSDVEYLKSQLDGLTSDLKYLVTYYTYSPIVGMTSQTDPNGKTTYYEYDSFGRLKLIKDNNGKILKKFDYHYSTSNQ